MIDMLFVEDEPLVAKRLERFAREALGDEAGKSAFARSVGRGDAHRCAIA